MGGLAAVLTALSAVNIEMLGSSCLAHTAMDSDPGRARAF
jgi:hypothetical protein